jgi:hypothetical protein
VSVIDVFAYMTLSLRIPEVVRRLSYSVGGCTGYFRVQARQPETLGSDDNIWIKSAAAPSCCRSLVTATVDVLVGVDYAVVEIARNVGEEALTTDQNKRASSGMESMTAGLMRKRGR